MQSINATIKNNATIINTTIKKNVTTKKHNKTKCNRLNTTKHNNWCVITIDVADNKTKTNPGPKHNQTKCNQ